MHQARLLRRLPRKASSGLAGKQRGNASRQQHTMTLTRRCSRCCVLRDGCGSDHNHGPAGGHWAAGSSFIGRLVLLSRGEATGAARRLSLGGAGDPGLTQSHSRHASLAALAALRGSSAAVRCVGITLRCRRKNSIAVCLCELRCVYPRAQTPLVLYSKACVHIAQVTAVRQATRVPVN